MPGIFQLGNMCSSSLVSELGKKSFQRDSIHGGHYSKRSFDIDIMFVLRS